MRVILYATLRSAIGSRVVDLSSDTTHIVGRGAVKDIYNLLADGIVQVLRVLAKLGPLS